MTNQPAAGSVPVFNCVVHVGREPDGVFVARVANLPGIEARGQSEREALAQAIAEFKSTLARFQSNGEPIPWLEKTADLQPGEAERLIAVHL